MDASLLEQLTRQTRMRYQQRERIRRKSEAALAKRRILDADTRRRVELRLSRLNLDRRTAEALLRQGAELTAPYRPGTLAAEDPVVLERVLGRNDLMPISFLQRGSRTAETIGRVTIRLADGRQGFGTGFLVGPRLLMTNNHVLEDMETARLSFVEFNYEAGEDGRLDRVTRFLLSPDELFVTDPNLDFTVVAVRPGDADLGAFGWNRLIPQEGKIIVGEWMNIIQHPNGELKQLALRENQLIDVLPDFLHYKSDTAPGSSGAPVFNDQWEVVALHHSGVPHRDGQGRILTNDGRLWKPSMGDHRINWIANEGARISRVVAALKAHPLTRDAARMRDAMFDQAPDVEAGTPSSARPRPRRAAAAAAPSVDADGSVTWEIPLTVSVRLGQPGGAQLLFPPPEAPRPRRDRAGPNVIVSYRMLKAMLDAPEANEFQESLDAALRGRTAFREATREARLEVSEADLAAFADEWHAALRALRDKSAEVDDQVLFSPQHRLACLMQSTLAERAAELGSVAPLRGDAAEALELKFARSDWWGWFKSLWSWVQEEEYHPIIRPPNAVPESIPNHARMAIFSDWGTGMYGAPQIAGSIRRQGGFDLVMHLGDVYYAGTRKEMHQRFLNPWPFGAGRRNRGLNSNHDMYSGGHAYFDDVLPAFQQPSSYFAMQNDRWLLIALDTAYEDFDVDEEQVAWIGEVVQGAGDRKTVLFSHHQLFSRLDDQGPKLAAKLRALLAARRVLYWYWGHEHRCVLYDVHPAFGLRARCVGHGGIPQKRGGVEDGAAEQTAGIYTWRRLTPNDGVPSSLALDGPNLDIPEDPDKYLPHGFATLELRDERLTETYYSAAGQALLRL